MMRNRRRAAPLALAVTLAIGGVVAGAAPAAAAPTTSAAPRSWDPRLEPIEKAVARLRHLDFEHPVAAEFLSDAAFEKKVAVDKGKLTPQDKREIERTQGQLRAVGLIDAGVDITDATSSLQTSGLLAYYDPRTKKITVKGTNLDDVSTRVTVAHELTHALQDQHFDLEKLERAAAKQHASTPLRTLIEGDAVRIQQDYVKSLSRADQDAYNEEQASTSATARDEVVAKGVPESLSVIFEAPYDLGPTMLDAVIAKDQVAGVDELFRHPPTADAAYLTPSTLVEHRTYPTVAPPKLAAGERRSGPPDVFGAFSLYQVLASRLDPSVALDAADAWGGDAMVTFTRRGTTCLRSTFRGTNAAGTTTIGDALSQWAAQMPAGAAQVDRAAGHVTLTACDPGAAATEAPNRALAALVFVASRDGVFSDVLGQGVSTSAATCTADTLVRDPAFGPVIDSVTTDPSAVPDPGVLAAVRARAPQILQECLASSTT